MRLRAEREARAEKLHIALNRLAAGHVDEPPPPPIDKKVTTTSREAALLTLPPERKPFFYEREDDVPHRSSPLPDLGLLRTIQGPLPLSLSSHANRVPTPSPSPADPAAAQASTGASSMAMIPVSPRSSSEKLKQLQHIDLDAGLEATSFARLFGATAGAAEGLLLRSFGVGANSGALRARARRVGDGGPHGGSDGETTHIVLKLEQAETRQKLRRWLAEENRAAQVLSILERAPPNFRQALTDILERLLCGDDREKTTSGEEISVLGGATAMVHSLGTQLVVHEAPLVSADGCTSKAVPALQVSHVGPRHPEPSEHGRAADAGASGDVGDSTLRITLSSRNGPDGSYLAGLSEITAVEITSSRSKPSSQ